MNDYPKNINNPIAKIQENSPLFIGLGVALIVLGLFALSSVVGVTIASVIMLGWLLLIAGIIEAVYAFWSKGTGEFFIHLLGGIFNGFVGLMMIANPAISAISLTLLLGAYFVVGGVIQLIMALRGQLRQKGWVIVNSLVSLVLGTLIIAQWPSSGLWVIGLFIGINLIITGWTLIAKTLELRRKLPASR